MKKLLILILGILLVGSVCVLASNIANQELIAELAPGTIDVFSPVQDQFYSERMVPINLSMSAEVKYFKYSDNGDKLVTLCRNCDEYGYSKVKKKPFDDGFHQLTIMAIFDMGEVYEYRNFSVDSIAPKISKTEPKRNSVINGSEFYIKYTEENLEKVELFWNPSQELVGCSAGRNQECTTSADLTSSDGKWIEYWFEVSDKINTAQSKKTRVFVDTTLPTLIVNLPQTQISTETYGRKVPFNITISEDVILEYYDNSVSRPRWKTLCVRCDDYGFSREKTKAFSRGKHNILIRAVDDAGNADVEERSFEVVY